MQSSRELRVLYRVLTLAYDTNAAKPLRCQCRLMIVILGLQIESFFKERHVDANLAPK